MQADREVTVLDEMAMVARWDAREPEEQAVEVEVRHDCADPACAVDDGQDFVADLAARARERVREALLLNCIGGQDVDDHTLQDDFVNLDPEFGREVVEAGFGCLVRLGSGWWRGTDFAQVFVHGLRCYRLDLWCHTSRSWILISEELLGSPGPSCTYFCLTSRCVCAPLGSC